MKSNKYELKKYDINTLNILSKGENIKNNIDKDTQYNNGITLISLVITIILLIILAGIVINISLGANGIFERAKQAKEHYTLSEAREKLETVLIEAVIEKETNASYNNADFLDGMLQKTKWK